MSFTRRITSPSRKRENEEGGLKQLSEYAAESQIYGSEIDLEWRLMVRLVARIWEESLRGSGELSMGRRALYSDDCSFTCA